MCVSSRTVGLKSRWWGRGCTCYLLLIRFYLLSCLGYLSVFVSTGMGAHTQCAPQLSYDWMHDISYKWE